MATTKRIRVNVIGAARDRGQVDLFEGTKKPVEYSQIIAIAADTRGTVMRTEGVTDDLIITETMDSIVANSGGNLITLTPLGFEGDRPGVKHSGRGKKIAVNPKYIVFKAGPKRGSIIRVEGSARGILVRETTAKIETLIDA